MSNNSTSSSAALIAQQCPRSTQWFGYVYLNDTLVKTVAGFSLALGISSTLANGLVLIAVYKTPSLRTMTNFFLTSLALTDFTMGSIIVPIVFFRGSKLAIPRQIPSFWDDLGFSDNADLNLLVVESLCH